MADTREDKLSGLRSLAGTLDYSEKSWIETKETLDKLKTWALDREKRYFYWSDLILQSFLDNFLRATQNVSSGIARKQGCVW